MDDIKQRPTKSANPVPARGQLHASSESRDETTEDADSEAVTSDSPKKEGFKSIISTLAVLIIAPLIALTITAFVFQSYEVDGPSMETTLQNHDRLIVYKLPRTIARITHHPYVPHRYDIIIFNRDDGFQFGTTEKRQLIKRVIAFAGERVVVKDGNMTVFNKEHPEGFRPDDAEYGKVIVTTPGDVDLVVPEGQIYVCGDNRPNSLDSRSFGPIQLNDVVGKLSLRVFPIGKGKRF